MKNRSSQSLGFTRNTYSVGVQLIRRTQTGSLPGVPALAALRIKPWSCIQ